MAKEIIIVKLSKREKALKLTRLALVVGLVIFCSAASCLAQNNLKYNFDYSIFGYDSISNYIEIYYSFDKSSFKAIATNDSYSTAVQLEISISNLNNDTLVNKSYILRDSSFSNFSKPNESIGVLKFVIPSGELSLGLVLTDKNDPDNFEKVNYKIFSVEYLKGNNKISGLQLATLITSDTSKSDNMFEKNNYQVIPNVSMVFDDQFSKLYYYTELYNLKSSNKLALSRQIIDSEGNVVYNKQSELSSNRKSQVKVGIINLESFSSGTYNLKLQIVDSLENILSVSEKKFYFYSRINNDKVQNVSSAQGYLSSEFAVYSEEECDVMINKMRYIATANELKQYQALTGLEDKRNFLFQFWEKRDFDKSTEINEYKEEVMNRIDEADKRFRTLKKDGSTTDRGRVLILYGMPDLVERYHNESGVKPYEIWKYYDIEGGVSFVFGDIIGLEDFRLLHSTKRGELSQPNWIERLKGN